MKEKVEEVLREIRPMLQADGGDIQLIEVVDKVVRVKLKGACAGCPMAQITMQRGVEARLKQRIPEIERVEAIAE